MKKDYSKKAAAIAIAITSLTIGLTFMTVASDAKIKNGAADSAVSYSAPAAGLSTDILLSSVDSENINVNFIAVSSVAQVNSDQRKEIIDSIEALIEQIEASVNEASGYAGAYDEAKDAYDAACDALDEANDLLKCAKEAQTSVLAQMYVQDVEALVQTAQACGEQAAADAQAAKEAEEKAAAEAAAREAEEKAAAEAAAKAAAEKAAAEAAAKAAAQKALAEAIANEASSAESTSEADSTRQALVSYALSFVGTLRYTSGGASLSSGVDCSGFTMAIYAAYGYSLPHSSSAQAGAGRSVSLSEIKAGDLVCYSGHVGIYIGNGQIVHAPNNGQYVSISSINIMTIQSVRRIIE